VDKVLRSIARLWQVAAQSEARSFKRYRGILLGGGFAGLAKLISLLTVAVSVPLTVRYLGNERYGMWMTISSFSSMLSFADLGIGNGLVTALAASSGRHEYDRMTRLVSSAFCMLVAVAGAISVVLLLAYPLVPWQRVFAVTSAEAVRESGPSILAFTLCFAASLPFTLVQRVQTGLQENWRANLWQIAASLFSLGAVVAAAQRRMGVVWLVLAMNGIAALVSMANSAIEFRIRRPSLRPKFAGYDSLALKDLMGSSIMFVALQLCVLAGSACDSIIIAQMFGAAAVSPYAVMYKIFQASVVFSLFMVPLWPALGEALARGDYAWARAALSGAVRLNAIIGTILAVVVLVGARAIVKAWVGGNISPDFLLVAAFSAWILLSAYGGAITSLLNNAQFLRLQVAIYSAASIAALILKVPMAHWMGPGGVVWATVVAYSLGYCVPAGLFARRFFQSHLESVSDP
jgi:O-antigen/teichoic acid export membrane protein